MRRHPNTIPKSQCKERILYRIHARNLRFGVFRAETGGFIGLRTKFGDTYQFEEFHWDNGPPYGTVCPLEELEALPEDIPNEKSLGTVCSVCGKDAEYTRFPGEHEMISPDGTTMEVPGEWKFPGEWQHLDGSPKCPKMGGYAKVNTALSEWLHQMERKYRDPIQE